MLSQEARFLEAREVRTARPRGKVHHDLALFWSALRGEWSRWESRLDALLQEERPHTASQRKESMEKLDILLADLQNLRRQSLSSTNVELPQADVRLLYQDFTKLATRLDQAREEIISPTKFTFQRYRAAMKGKEGSTVGESKKTVSTNKTLLPSRLTLGASIIQDYCDATLTLDNTSLLSITQTTDQETTTVRQQERDTSSLLLQNLSRCRVDINKSYKALHIQNVTNCVVRAANAMDGAVHVTACREMELYATCHQLRMHESKDLKCHVKVGTGPILEDCTGIILHASGEENDLTYDAKDFNWLRNRVPSPNFCIVKESDESRDMNVVSLDTAASNPVRVELGSEEARQPSTTTSSNDAQSDEDDEL